MPPTAALALRARRAGRAPPALALRRARCRAAAAAAEQEPSASGRSTYRPSSYTVMVTDAVRALQAAVRDGERLVEIEFPPLPSNKDPSQSNSEQWNNANLQLAVAAAKQVAATGQRVQILLPDSEELRRAEQTFGAALSTVRYPPGGGVSFGSLTGSRRGEFAAVGDFFFGAAAAAGEELTSAAELYLACNMSCIELPDLEAWATSGRRAPGSTLCCFNLELETHRGDLGLPGFPPKSLHHRFLARILPVFFLRQRSYSKTVAVAPFLLNYSGATLREYPGPWQVMLRTDDGQLACIAERPQRYGLGEAKEELMAAMGLNTEAEGSALNFLRRGYKTATWWEEASQEEESKAWRS